MAAATDTAAASTGRPAATRPPKTSTSTIRVTGSDMYSARLQVLLDRRPGLQVEHRPAADLDRRAGSAAR